MTSSSRAEPVRELGGRGPRYLGAVSLRVVGGQAGGRTLHAPAGTATRPTSDRVREAVFSILDSMGAVEGASVLDLFAGSGAYGIESVSRGAAAAVLVDSRPEAVQAIRRNVEVLGLRSAAASVVRADALRYLAGAPRFDIVFADPPYAYARWPDLLAALAAVAGLLVAETGSSWQPGERWETVKHRRYGGTLVSIAQPTTQEEVVRAEEGEI